MSRLDQLQLQFRERLRVSHNLRDATNTSASAVSAPSGISQNGRPPTVAREAGKLQEIRRPRPVIKPPAAPVSSNYSSARLIRPPAAATTGLPTVTSSSSSTQHHQQQPSSNGRRASVDLPSTAQQPNMLRAKATPSATRPGPHANGSRATSIQASGRRASTSREAPKELLCSICSRKFAMADRLAVHEPICAKASSKNRKQFDSSKQRFKNQPKEYLQAYQRALKAPTASVINGDGGECNWRLKHNRVIEAIRAAKYEACTSIELV